jgi:hypothetical protein
MRDMSDASERELYQRLLASMMEVAQLLLTLQSIATLDPTNMRSIRGLVVDNIFVLLDDLEHYSSQGLNNGQIFSLHLDIAIAIENDWQAAEHYRRLDQALRQVESDYSNYRTTRTAVTVDTLSAEAHSDLGRAISNAKDAFRRLATESGSDRMLLDDIGRLLWVIGGIRGDLNNLGDMHVTAAFTDRTYRTAVVDTRPRLRDAVSDEPREIVDEGLRRATRDNLRGTGRSFDL